jgi:hypothetical protein
MMFNILICMIALRMNKMFLDYESQQIRRAIVTRMLNVTSTVETRINHLFEQIQARVEKTKNNYDYNRVTNDTVINSDPYLSPEFNILFLIL